jgi:hypothetical protein
MTRPRDPADEDFAQAFLGGLWEEKGGVVSHRYFEKGSEIEARAQAALVRLLRGDRPLTDAIRWRLAGLFDPKSSDDRQLKIAPRRKGPKRVTPELAFEIARYIAVQYKHEGVKIEAAMAAACKRYSVSLRTVERAWAEHKSGPLIRPLLHGDHTIN